MSRGAVEAACSLERGAAHAVGAAAAAAAGRQGRLGRQGRRPTCGSSLQSWPSRRERMSLEGRNSRRPSSVKT
jgi:hypothetical protein